MIKGILFDKDGTLIDFFAVWPVLAREVIPKFIRQNEIFDEDGSIQKDLLERIGLSDDKVNPRGAFAYKSYGEIADDICAALTDHGVLIEMYSIYMQIKDLFKNTIKNSTPIYKTFTDMPDLMRGLKKKGLYIGLATADIQESAERMLNELNNLKIDVKQFIQDFREAFGQKAALPLLFGYSDQPVADTERINGCFFKGLKAAREGVPVSLSAEVIACGGGKLYTGFTDMPERVPGFVSLKEKYKKTPQMVADYVENLGMKRAEKKYLNFVRIDKAESFDGFEGILFYATPDMLSGLCGWAFFDSNAADAVVTQFGSGCSTVVSMTIVENARQGQRCFMGLFDPSVRPYVGPNELSFTIPMSRFKNMTETMKESFLFDSHAWKKVKARLEE